jgi:hypothetical protein
MFVRYRESPFPAGAGRLPEDPSTRLRLAQDDSAGRGARDDKAEVLYVNDNPSAKAVLLYVTISRLDDRLAQGDKDLSTRRSLARDDMLRSG